MDSSFIVTFFIQNALPPTLLILGTAAVRRLWRRLPKKLFYVLWTTLTLRLLIPFSAGLPLLPARDEAVTLVPGGAVLHRAGFSVTAVTEADVLSVTEGNSPDALIALYIAIAAAMAVYFVIGHIRGLRKYRFSLPVPRTETAEMTSALGIKRVYIRSCRGASPAAFGIFVPTVILPEEKVSRHILAHELVHIRRHDPLLLTLLSAALCIHWANPAVWLMYSLARRDMELSCDEEAVRVFRIPPKDYAMTLIYMEEQRSDRFAAFGKKPVAERIEQLIKGAVPMNRAAVIMAAIVSGLSFTSLEHAPSAADENVAAGEFSAYEEYYAYDWTEEGYVISHHRYYNEPVTEAYYEEAPAETEHRISREKAVMVTVMEDIPEFKGDTAAEISINAAEELPTEEYSIAVADDFAYTGVYMISAAPSEEVEAAAADPEIRIMIASED